MKQIGRLLILWASAVFLMGQTSGGKTYISFLSLLDSDTRSVMAAGDSETINAAVAEALDALARIEPKYAFNQPGNTVPNNDANASKLNDIFWDANLRKTEKIDKIISEIMSPNGVDKLLFGNYSQKPDGSILIRITTVDRAERRLFTESFSYKKEDIDCRNKSNSQRLCMDADIRDVAITMLDPSRGQGRLAERLTKSIHEEEQLEKRTIGVLFATNRVIDRKEAELSRQLTSKRSAELTYGAAHVRVPEGHVLGAAERPLSISVFGVTLLKTAEIERQHFILRDLKLFDATKAGDVLRGSKERAAMIFVHGYNTTFEDGIFRTAQLAYDTRFQGTPIAFIWPSKGGFADYDYDRESVLFSSEAFLQLLGLIQKDGAIEKLYLIAHSMGNHIVLEALAQARQRGMQLAISELIMAAPDVDRDNFVQLIGRLQGIGGGLTLYASSADAALKASRLKAGGARAGDVSDAGPIVMPGIMDTIDVTALGDDPLALNHSVALSSRSLMDDIGRLLRSGTRPPGDRSPQLVAVPDAPPTRYWRYPK